jgi:hypothetical protein
MVALQLRTAGYDVGAMESFGAQADLPLDVCLRELRKSDVAVLIVGPKYGSLLPQGISYTQAEFREARSVGIPVLAFRVPDEPGLEQDEKDRLLEFLTEVGSTTTYKSLESLDSLSGEIHAALKAASDRGELGSRYSIFQPYQRFFSQQLGANPALFSHEGPFIGRDAELRRVTEFLADLAPVMLIKASGGSGKSRLLLEVARYAASTRGAPMVLFVDSGGQWTADDINRLPVTPLLLVVDDAHRRPDLDRLIFACLQHNHRARFIVSCRPSALGVVTSKIAVLFSATSIPEVVLPPLAKGDAEAMARHHLGEGLSGLAPRLVQIADRNPLVITVGAKCIATHRVPPEMLERTPELFRSLVLDRLLDDPGLGTADAATRRRLLEVVAAVGPVVAESEELLTTLSSVVDSPKHEMRRLLAALERSSFLVRHGRLVRVSPDVLADHLLYRAAVDETGHPTGFVEEMVSTFSPTLLENILANAAELDWRAPATAKHEAVLATTWKNLRESLPRATHPQRAALVGQLKRAAVFAPEEVLSIIEWLADNREAPPDEARRTWGLEDSFEEVGTQLVEVLGSIANYRDLAVRCMQKLWDFAASDSPSTRSRPQDPRRRLHDLMKYEWRADWREENSSHDRVVRFMVAKLTESHQDDRSWAVGIVGGALERFGEANEFNRRGITLRQFSLAPFLPDVAERRRIVTDCLRELAVSSNSLEAAAALDELSKLFRPPTPQFGQQLPTGEIDTWQLETEQAIQIVAEAAKYASTDAIRFIARRSLRDAPRRHWPQITSALDSALEQSPRTVAEGLYDLLVGIPWEEQLDDFQAEENRVDALCKAAALDFWNQHTAPSVVVTALLTANAAIQQVAKHGESHAGRLMRSLVLTMPSQAEAVVRAIVESGEAGWKFLRPALVAMYDISPVETVRLADELTRDEHETVRAFVTEPLQWMAETESTLQLVLEIAGRLSQDPSPAVKQIVPQVLRRLRTKAPEKALSILVSIDWADDPGVAASTLNVLHPEYGLDPGNLKNDDIDILLRKIATLRSIEGREHGVLDFIAFASSRRPKGTVDMLLERIFADDKHQNERGPDRWTPIPYGGHGLTLPGLTDFEEFPALLRQIRDAQLGAGPMVRFWLPTLFRASVMDIAIGLDVLREWLQSGDAEKITAVAHILRGFDHTIVFSEDEFVAELLDAAAKAGPECLASATSELFAIAISGGHWSAPGQPAPRYLSDKASAQTLIEKHQLRTPVREFYEALMQQAESSIERDMLSWDEEGDE